MIVRESQVEDVLATYPDIAKDILGVSEELTLLGRQKVLPSGQKIDLLFVADSRLKLVELKVEKCVSNFIYQVRDYRTELIELQNDNKLVAGDIDAFLLSPEIDQEQSDLCESEGIIPLEYLPQDVLDAFFARLRNFANFITLKPADHGLWHLNLSNRLLYALTEKMSKNELSVITALSVSTVSSYLRLVSDLNLVEITDDKKYRLSDLGKKYVWGKDTKAPIEFISDEQAKTLQDFIIKDPFASRTTFGIYTIVEVIFTLSKNTHPVPLNIVMDYFRKSSGKYFEWSTDKTIADGTKMYSNYATELGLIGRVGDKFYIAPDGIRFVLLLQLHKSIKMVDALGISR